MNRVWALRFPVWSEGGDIRNPRRGGKKQRLHNAREFHVRQAQDWPHWIKLVSGLIGLQTPSTPRGHVHGDTHSLWLLPAHFWRVHVWFSLAPPVNRLKTQQNQFQMSGVFVWPLFQDRHVFVTYFLRHLYSITLIAGFVFGDLMLSSFTSLRKDFRVHTVFHFLSSSSSQMESKLYGGRKFAWVKA